MRKTLAFIALAVTAFGCRHDVVVPDGGKLELTVRATWNGEPFDKNTIYLNALDQRVKVSQLKFYLSRLNLEGDGSKELFDADLFDVTDGPVLRTYELAPAEYDSITVGLGLPVELNHAEPVLFPVSHPLGAGSGMNWDWTEQFHRFVLFDGRWDSDPDAIGLPPFLFSMHTGRDDCFRMRSITHAFSISAGNTTQLTIDLDIARFFTNADGTVVFDLSQGSQSHGGLPELPRAMLLSDLMIAAIDVH
jgi:hypothetical protein